MNIKKIFVLAFMLVASLSSTCLSSSKPDTHSFLFEKYPELREKAAALLVIDNHEETLKMSKVPSDRCMSAYQEAYLKNGFFEAPAVRLGDKECATLHLFEQQHLSLEKKGMGKLSPFYQMYFSRKIDNAFDMKVLEDITLAAEQIHHSIQNMDIPDPERTCVLFLGRTPCLIQLAMERIQLRKPKDRNLNLIHMNYSGNADTLSKRDRSLYPLEKEIIRNMVTPDKMDFYKGYMAMKQLQLYKKIIVVDVITTGGGLSGWRRLLKTFCRERALGMPQLHFMALSEFVYSMHILIAPPRTSKDPWIYDRNAKRIEFKADETCNVHPFTIPTTPYICVVLHAK